MTVTHTQYTSGFKDEVYQHDCHTYTVHIPGTLVPVFLLQKVVRQLQQMQQSLFSFSLLLFFFSFSKATVLVLLCDTGTVISTSSKFVCPVCLISLYQ